MSHPPLSTASRHALALSFVAAAVACPLLLFFEWGAAPAEDAAILAMRAYEASRDNMLLYLSNSSHIRRLQRLGINKDIKYCLQKDLYDVVPVLRGNELVLVS